MFKNCTSLTYTPELPATTMASSCYMQMFYGCTSLTTVHDLPSTTLVAGCYRHMFRYCSSLERAPVMYFSSIPASSCVSYMFANCPSLNYIELRNLSSWLDDGSTPSWVDGVSASGLFVCPAALGTNATITRGTSNCPTGWTVANPVEYLQSTGTQWIDTGVTTGASNLLINATMSIPDSADRNFVLGAGTDYSYAGHSANVGSYESKWSMLQPGIDYNYITPISSVTQPVTFTWSISGNTSTLSGDLTKSTTNTSSYGTGAAWRNSSICLFSSIGQAGGTIGGSYFKQIASIEKCSIALDNSVVRDYYPVRVDSTGCLLDKANLTGGTNNDGLYYNAGTGSFTLGPDV